MTGAAARLPVRGGLLALCLALAIAPAFRSASGRESEVTPDLERAVAAGLDYLARTQREDGAWPDNYGGQPGVVGLAVLAFLAHGETPDDPRHGPVIERGVRYILDAQQANGLLASHGSPMYNHGFATLALAEVYGVVDDPRIGPALKQAVGLIESSQNARGGWRYNPTPSDADTTVSGAQMLALRGAASAGIEVPSEVVQKGAEFFKSCFIAGGGYGYMGPDGVSHARAGIGMLVLALTGHYRDPQVKATADWILGNLATMDPADGYGYYATYYMGQAMYQAGGRYWRNWLDTMHPRILSLQQADGSWTGQFGTTASTAFALLSVEIPYDLLPIYQR